MATRAEQFRSMQERSGWKRRAGTGAKAAAPKPAVAGSRLRAGKKAEYALEQSEGRPSRKSTRSSANRQKNDVQFRQKRRVSEARVEDRPRPTR